MVEIARNTLKILSYTWYFVTDTWNKKQREGDLRHQHACQTAQTWVVVQQNPRAQRWRPWNEKQNKQTLIHYYYYYVNNRIAILCWVVGLERNLNTKCVLGSESSNDRGAVDSASSTGLKISLDSGTGTGVGAGDSEYVWNSNLHDDNSVSGWRLLTGNGKMGNG